MNRLPRSFGGTSPKLVMIKTGLTGGFAIVSLIEGKPIDGPDIAFTCGTNDGFNLTFSDKATAPFSSAAAPYTGMFLPSSGAMRDFESVTPDGTWELQMSNLNGPVQIQCWVVEFKTVAKKSPALRPR